MTWARTGVKFHQIFSKKLFLSCVRVYREVEGEGGGLDQVDHVGQELSQPPRLPHPQPFLRVRGADLWCLDQLSRPHLWQLPHVLWLHRYLHLIKWIIDNVINVLIARTDGWSGGDSDHQVESKWQVQLWIRESWDTGWIHQWSLSTIYIILHIQWGESKLMLID